MKLIVILFFIFGCAADEPYFEPGIFDETGSNLDTREISENLNLKFSAVEEMTGLRGDSSSIHLVIVPIGFPCTYSDGLCGGEFYPRNKIKIISSMRAGQKMCHEIVHYLLYFNYGDSDPNHNAPFFEDCVRNATDTIY